MRINFPLPCKNVTVILDDALTVVDLDVGYFKNSVNVTHNGVELSDTMELDQYGFYYHMSDDGTIFYHSMYVISPEDENLVTMPSKNAILVSFKSNWGARFVELMIDPETSNSQDVAYAVKLMTIPACFAAFYDGGIQSTHTKIFNKILGIAHP